MAAPLRAEVLLPYTFAETFCDLREMGVSEDDAISAAVAESMIPGEETYVTYEGSRTGLSTIKAVKRQEQVCPQY